MLAVLTWNDVALLVAVGWWIPVGVVYGIVRSVRGG